MSARPEMPYMPTALTVKLLQRLRGEVQDELFAARVALAELHGFSAAIPNPMLLLSPALLRESLASSEIENIHTTLVDVLENQLFPDREQRETDKEVLRYRDAMLWGYEQLDHLSVSGRLVKGVHAQLLPSLSNGYRTQQNVMADGHGKTIYTPPTVPDMKRALSSWERFMHASSVSVDPLLKAVAGHYQFEAIHPFPDGNGRTGRILFVLQLIHDDLLTWPSLYISGYINEKKTQYYRSLRHVTQEDDWASFASFLLRGVARQAEETVQMVKSMKLLLEETKSQLKQQHKDIASAELVEALFYHPIVTPTQLAKDLRVHYTTATRYLEALQKGGLLREKRVGKYRFFVYDALISLLSPRS